MKLARMSAAGTVLTFALGVTLASQPAAPRTSADGNGHFSFALIGDMPYGPEGDLKFPNVLADINADRTVVRRARRRHQEQRHVELLIAEPPLRRPARRGQQQQPGPNASG